MLQLEEIQFIIIIIIVIMFLLWMFHNTFSILFCFLYIIIIFFMWSRFDEILPEYFFNH